MGQWIGAQGQVKVAKKMQNPPQRTPNQKCKKLFLMSTRRLAESVEGFNSSLALAASDLWPKKGEPIDWLLRSLKGYEFIYSVYLFNKTNQWLLMITFSTFCKKGRQLFRNFMTCLMLLWKSQHCGECTSRMTYLSCSTGLHH